MWSILLLIATLLCRASSQTCAPTQLTGNTQSLNQCRFGQYDFSPLAQVDLYGLANGRQYVHRLCGSVRDPLCPANSSACMFSNNQSICDTASSATSVLDTNAIHKMGYIDDTPSLGVSITAVTAGLFCSNGLNHTVVTNIYCSGPNVPDRLASISTIEVGCLCQTTFSLYSSLACPPSMNVTAPPASVVTLPPPALPCTLGQFGVDLHSQFTNDIHVYSSSRNERIVLNLCGAVRDTGCTQFAKMGQAASACAITRCQNVTAVAMMYNYQTPTWQYTNAVNNSNGYTMVNYIDSTNIFVVRLRCNVNATQPNVTQMNYPSHGIREVVIESSLACVNESALTLPAPRCTSGCCGMGYDFSPLKNVEVTGFANNYNGAAWSFTMCGSLRANCNGAMACTSPLCTAGVAPGTVPLSYWRGQDQVQWSYINGLDFTGGVRMVTLNGDSCNGAPRRTEVSFKCDPTAFVPRATNLWQYPLCVYQATIYTTVVCAAPAYLGGAANIGNHNTSANGVVVAPAKPIFGCQFAGYDFSPIGSNDFEAGIAPYIFHIRICGMQTHPKCAVAGNGDVSVCQMDYGACSDDGPGGHWIVSLWNPFLVKWGFVDDKWENGVSMQLQTGDYCGSVPRSMLYNFVCDPAAVVPYQDQGFEAPGSYICNYFIRIRTNIVCPPPPAFQNGSLTLSSSSTGSKWPFRASDNAASMRTTFSWLCIMLMVIAALL